MSARDSRELPSTRPMENHSRLKLNLPAVKMMASMPMPRNNGKNWAREKKAKKPSTRKKAVKRGRFSEEEPQVPLLRISTFFSTQLAPSRRERFPPVRTYQGVAMNAHKPRP